jgi:hypothetical protein
MNTSSAQLLKQLEPAVRPGIAPAARSVRPGAPFEAQGFDQLLALAKQGQIHSGRQIETAFEPSPPLSAAQLERLASAADQAEAGGAKRALMLIDGRGFVMDVASRTLVSELNSDANAAVLDIDAAIHVPAELNASPGTLKLPGDGFIPPSVFKQLSTAGNDQKH